MRHDRSQATVCFFLPVGPSRQGLLPLRDLIRKLPYSLSAGLIPIPGKYLAPVLLGRDST